MSPISQPPSSALILTSYISVIHLLNWRANIDTLLTTIHSSYIRIHSLCYIFYESWQMYTDMHLPLHHHTKQFHCPTDPLCSIYLSFLPFNPSDNRWSDHHIFFIHYRFFSPTMSCSWLESCCTVGFSYRLLSLRNIHLSFSHTFYGLINSLIFIPEWPFIVLVYYNLSIYLEKNILSSFLWKILCKEYPL